MILVDRDSKLLSNKANRDTYDKPGLGEAFGKSRIGSENSEDALTWNVVRSLDLGSRLDIMVPGVLKTSPAEVVYWSEGQGPAAHALHEVLNRIEAYHLAKGHQQTEIDVLIWQRPVLIGIEAKLAAPGKRKYHPWSGRDNTESKYKKFYKDSARQSGLFRDLDAPVLYRDGYQLMRHSVILVELARALGATHTRLVVVVNEHNRRTSDIDKQFDEFQAVLNQDIVQSMARSWQQIALDMPTGLARIREYLQIHPCLSKVSEASK